ncbi:HAMP domain-containing histidine kinase [Clostridium estertheticum]|uniref:histidine kinase n=1 Tax=Clostridium estertheticum TaxID=238834 RepID=A0AA47I5P8_9CLOT|nr:HAMP domain-containing sensor histidine kinase [Clostridium estertheticum]MBU3156289.1 HAMP domain-containing histidine kinase [Clostridium estertheticum]MBU3200792.1 HAMP domain-containing histidine kinase [Clostridium estertheticum]WAG59813.1 HAMP domain-containing histidine kinase [Clostridium estertheticum]WAG66116.1 HAMP domain-containing histidine kinase [Clostridium estertheticum]
MNIKKRLIFSNTVTVIVPFVITIVAAVLFIFISSTIFKKDVSYDNFKKFIFIKTQLADTSNIVRNQSSYNIENIKYQQYLHQKLSTINGEIIILKSNTIIFTSKDVNKIDIEKCLVEANTKFEKKLVEIEATSYMVEVAPIRFSDGNRGNVILLAPVFRYSSILEEFIIFIVAIFLISFIALNIYMSYLLSKRIIKPLSLLSIAVGEISKGDLSLEIIEVGDQEIKKLCADFEKMRIQLKDSIRLKKKYDENRTMLVSSISHDLKTPITSIKGYVNGILDGVANTPEKADRYLKTIYSKATQMDIMINDLLLYSKLDLSQLPFNFENTDIMDYFKYCIHESAPELEKSNIEICLKNNLDGLKYVKIDRERLMRVILNIIDNSRKYMDKEQGKITIILRETNSSIIIEIRDNGSGIDENDVNKIFDRFYRADAARSEANGSGLGLAIAKQIVEGHGGTIWAVSHENEGTSILMSFGKISNKGVL